jgi:hypothetical protein
MVSPFETTLTSNFGSPRSQKPQWTHPLPDGLNLSNRTFFDGRFLVDHHLFKASTQITKVAGRILEHYVKKIKKRWCQDVSSNPVARLRT